MTLRFLILTLLLLLYSCRPAPDKSEAQKSPGVKEMANLNRYLIQKDRERIENYIERRNLQMTVSPSGLWYQIIREGDGRNPGDNDHVVIEYSCSLLDGTICYSSELTGPKDIVIGRTEMAAGLNQGLKMLRPGGEAIFIIPPYLAYGLKGDGNKIPARSVIVYEIKLLNSHHGK